MTEPSIQERKIKNEKKTYIRENICPFCNILENHPKALECAWREFGDEDLCPRLGNWLKENTIFLLESMIRSIKDNNDTWFERFLTAFNKNIELIKKWGIEI